MKKPRSKLVLGTRASRLALWQAEHVKGIIEKFSTAQIQIKKITTKGDQILNRSLIEVGGKGLFLKEIEDELLAGTIDLAAHSLKDVPYELPPGLVLVAILRREDPRDVFISRQGLKISELKGGAVIGTSSLRRLVQLNKKHPGLSFKTLRGNVDTRLRKLKQGEYDGIVLAYAGLKRLGLESEITEFLDIVPAVGQGAIVIECRADDQDVIRLVSRLNDKESARCVSLERLFLKHVQGSCETPLGCHVEPDPLDAERFVMRCFAAQPDGSHYIETTLNGSWEEGELVVSGVVLPY